MSSDRVVIRRSLGDVEEIFDVMKQVVRRTKSVRSSAKAARRHHPDTRDNPAKFRAISGARNPCRNAVLLRVTHCTELCWRGT
jgi:hypothetical protein